MSNDLLNILSNSNKDIDNQLLMDYLAGKLSAAQQHEVEKLMADNSFMNDAVEGLQQVKDQKNVNVYVEQLNRDLRKRTGKKTRARNKRKFKDQPWIYVAAIIILLLLVVAWVVVSRMKHIQ
jgi:anti-sigma factor RsiW